MHFSVIQFSSSCCIKNINSLICNIILLQYFFLSIVDLNVSCLIIFGGILGLSLGPVKKIKYFTLFIPSTILEYYKFN